MQLTDISKEICRQHYISYKTPGCSKCPIQQTCHGKRFPDTADGLKRWENEINQLAEMVKNEKALT